MTDIEKPFPRSLDNLSIEEVLYANMIKDIFESYTRQTMDKKTMFYLTCCIVREFPACLYFLNEKFKRFELRLSEDKQIDLIHSDGRIETIVAADYPTIEETWNLIKHDTASMNSEHIASAQSSELYNPSSSQVLVSDSLEQNPEFISSAKGPDYISLEQAYEIMSSKEVCANYSTKYCRAYDSSKQGIENNVSQPKPEHSSLVIVPLPGRDNSGHTSADNSSLQTTADYSSWHISACDNYMHSSGENSADDSMAFSFDFSGSAAKREVRRRSLVSVVEDIASQSPPNAFRIQR